MLRRLGAAALFSVLPLHLNAGALPVRVDVVDRSAAQNCLENAVISAVTDDAAVEVPVRSASSPAAVHLDDRQPWQVRLRKNGCWSTTATWIAESGKQHVALELFAAATLEGQFTVPAGHAPSALPASLYRIRSGDRTAGHAAAEPLDCILELPAWRCTIPAELPIDVRLEPPDFAPVYLWSITGRSGERRITEPQKLVFGSSVAGWVEDPSGDPVADAHLTLAPLQPAHDGFDRATAAQHRATTDSRGFFQFRGVPPGDYRLASRAAAFAPVLVPVITVRPLDAITWPRPLRHAPSVTLKVTVDPPESTDGSAWRLVATERIPLTPGAPPASVALVPDGNGFWSASGLRPDVYELVVKDAGDALLERMVLDLSNGAPDTLTISSQPSLVAGVVRVGGEPLAAAFLRFTNASGKSVALTSDEDGRFTATFPAPGRWTPLVYPYGRQRGAQVRTEPVDISSDTGLLEILLPGGRLRGTVVLQRDPVKAAVHVTKNGVLVAQQTTAADGRFDFLGLPEAAYAVSAEAEEGATPRPVEANVRAHDTAEVTLAVEPYRVVSGVVRTPAGQPASGATVRISTDGGLSWSDLVAGVQGDFEYVVPSGINEVSLVVVTYSYPSAMVRVAVGSAQPLSITLLPAGGMLRVLPDRAYIVRQNIVAPVNAFYVPASLGLMRGAHLEPGTYAVCRQPRANDDCRQVLVGPGTTTTVDLQNEGNAP